MVLHSSRFLVLSMISTSLIFNSWLRAFHEVQPWSSSASLALNFPSDYDVLKSMLSHDMSQETHLPRSDSVHQFPLCSSFLPSLMTIL